MKYKWDTIDLLRHARHDWLNQLQLIKGNLSLDRTDRAKEIVDEVVHQAKNEAKISNMKMPLMAELLMTYNWQQNIYRVDFEVIGEEKVLTSYDEPLYEWTSHFLTQVKERILLEGESHLLVTIQISDEDVRISFDFEGKLDNIDSIDSFNRSLIPVHNSISIAESYYKENELLYILRLE
ncbi:Spo0B C-terminal domain-containing protein [Alkalihalobacillus sp. AL-G]|uniref:Spo0B C-terminal domain-containing protein n=1 Tax=Alkalihalobacillus sp. AL-G TaxID=2926399 RepID=UPI002729C9B9|nr:Spo0B C-terminal domain-containing protein [Alkalihalobacillus sp. AL-G]WLD92230.1 sporulation initiation phosphotransferase B [Alkalihalobacillus sp. AL-G]